MIHDPAVMILDEPAAGLDPRARIQLRRMIRELADRGKTILISSHILTELAEMCDTVGIIEQGQLLATGSVEEIRAKREAGRELTIRIVSDIDPAAAMIAERLTLPLESGAAAGVPKLVVDGQLLRFPFIGSPDDQAALIRDLVLAGHAVTEVASSRISLEDVFLQVTEGLVQ